MIRATISSGEPAFAASVNGIAIYLDNWAIKAFAKGDTQLRERFVAAVNNGAEVLFSSAHALEALGPQGRSSDAFMMFLNQLGAHWYPVESNIFKVLERENAGKSGSDCSFDEDLLRAYFQSATATNIRGSGTIIDLSESFFKLGNWINWLAPQRGELDKLRLEYEEMLRDYIVKLRDKFKKKPALLNVALPATQFSPSTAAHFAFVHLLRNLIADRGFQIKQGDAMDLGHAVIASAFANFATLDKQWKRRVEQMPKPNQNPRIYYEPELEDMVTDLENALIQLHSLPKGSPLNLPLKH